MELELQVVVTHRVEKQCSICCSISPPPKDLFLLMCVYATYLQVPKEARGGIRSFGAGVSEECELLLL